MEVCNKWEATPWRFDPKHHGARLNDINGLCLGEWGRSSDGLCLSEGQLIGLSLGQGLDCALVRDRAEPWSRIGLCFSEGQGCALVRDRAVPE